VWNFTAPLREYSEPKKSNMVILPIVPGPEMCLFFGFAETYVPHLHPLDLELTCQGDSDVGANGQLTLRVCQMIFQ